MFIYNIYVFYMVSSDLYPPFQVNHTLMGCLDWTLWQVEMDKTISFSGFN